MVVKIPTQDEEIFLLLFFSPILMTYPIFLTPFRALVIGSTGAIGEAFVKAFKADSQCEHVEELSRSQNPGFDLNHPQDFEGCLEKARAAGPYQIIVDATGKSIATIRGRSFDALLSSQCHWPSFDA